MSIMRKCKYCGSTHNLMEMTKLHGMKLSFERGMEVERIGRTITMCNACFMERIWSKKNA